MGDNPVNFVSWFGAARVPNWLMNGATGTSSTETGAYTLNGAISGTAPTVNPGATYSIPTENQWYKAVYYKGGSTHAGYWTYATLAALGLIEGATANISWNSGARSMSISVVPEPSTWLMAAGGLGCAAWGAFRLRKRA